MRMRFGHGGLVGLEFQPEAGVDSWLDHQEAGRCSGDGLFARLAYLTRLNLAYNYINALRKFSNDPAWLARMARIERRLAEPLSGAGPVRINATRYRATDYHVVRGAVPPPLLGTLRHELMNQASYHDPAIPGWAYRGRVEAAPYATLSMDSHALFASDTFWRICANPLIIGFCRDVLGSHVALSWAWAWINNPGYIDSPRWKWHRSNSEPFNAMLIVVPLDEVTTREHGPMMLIPGSSMLADFAEPRLYGDDEMADLRARQPAGTVFTEVGDVAFVNPFALRRVLPPYRRQRMLMLLASIGPSHRSPAVRRRSIEEVPEDVRDLVEENRRFFHRLMC